MFIASMLHVFNISAGVDDKGRPQVLTTDMQDGLLVYVLLRPYSGTLSELTLPPITLEHLAKFQLVSHHVHQQPNV